jgi:uncharacterized protein YdeI (YjbR/CyaY-like superfamily)
MAQRRGRSDDALPVTSNAVPRVAVPPDLRLALEGAGAGDRFAAFSFSHQNEYVRWIEEAKRPETRRSRIAKTVERTKLKSR